MKSSFLFLKIFLNTLGIIAPKTSAKIAFNLFQKVRLKELKKREKPFYDKVKSFNISLENDELHCYEMGSPDGKLVFMIHGWDSNAGSLTLFAEALAKKGYRIITFDLLAHHKSIKKYTNLFETKKAFKQLLKHINPKAPFSVIGHSFGASALAYTLSETDYKLDKIVLLSSNNKILEVFRGFQKFIGFNEKIFQAAKNYIDQILDEDFAQMETSKKLKAIDFKKLLLIHDKKDKVLPFHNAVQIHEAFPQKSTLIPFERIGHYRMLWNKEVVQETVDFLDK
jgi:pimeloyl-ACP methyl ester carboxylesterase